MSFQPTMIDYDETNRVFHLHNGLVSYALGVAPGGYLTHLYFGRAVRRYHGTGQEHHMSTSFSPLPAGQGADVFGLNDLPLEYPGSGFGDYRVPAHEVVQPDGTAIADLRYQSHRITAGKPALPGLPATYATDDSDAETLTVVLGDPVNGTEVALAYTIFRDRAVITRSVVVTNRDSRPKAIRKAASASLDFTAPGFELIHLSGSYAKERHLVRERLTQETRILDSKRGASSHYQNPTFALVAPGTTEHAGAAYGFGLVYSGNHECVIEQNDRQQVRVMAGINPAGFAWNLAPGASFQTPEVILTYTDQGLNGLSATWHRLINDRLIRGRYRHHDRPIVINNWEATYFDFDEAKILAIVAAAKRLGVEAFVLDDGWFGHRDDDRSSLGDWVTHAQKLPAGLAHLAQVIHQQGMQFGLWFEPEMISEDSELFAAHPDYRLAIPGRAGSAGRHQFTLDFSRADVRQAVLDQMCAVLDHTQVDFIKWDMNRNMSEVFSAALPAYAQGEVTHRYMLGLYDMLERLTTRYPEILFEGCSGGGGRFDLGMLAYTSQIWTSDDTDAVSRLKIQYGTSLFYPLSTISAHVSAVPNHQFQRVTSMALRGAVASSGVLGYELDATKLTESEQAAVREQIVFYQAHRRLLQYGRLTRLLSPFEGGDTAWQISDDRGLEAVVVYARPLAEEAPAVIRLRLFGLDANRDYAVLGQRVGGDELMGEGLLVPLPLSQDYAGVQVYLKAVTDDE